MSVKTATIRSGGKPSKKKARQVKQSSKKPKDVFGFDEKKLLAYVESVQAERIQFEKENPDI